MVEMVRVALVSFKYPPVYSGYGKQLKLVTEGITKMDSEISFTLLTAYEESLMSNAPDIKIKSLLEKEDDKNSKSIYPFARKVFKWLIFNSKNFDIIHCVKAGPEALACQLASNILNKPLVIKVAQDELSDREIDSVKGIKKNIRKFRQKRLSKVNNYIAISDEIEENLLRRVKPGTNIFRIPNGVDSNRFSPLIYENKHKMRSKLKISTEEIALLYIGAINSRKGIVDLLDALELYESKIKLKAILCGPILEEIDFEKRIALISKKENVSIDYRGSVSNVDEFMQASDIFILPSYSEGLPNVLLEAASTGLPLITTDIGGSRDIVDDGINGFIVSLNSPEKIQEKIAQLSENEVLRSEFGRMSREKIKNYFSIDIVRAKYSNLYHTLVK